jgi:hypothetical protein
VRNRAEGALKTAKYKLSMVILVCNPSYPGGRDQEDHGSKPAQTNNSRDPISK